MAVQETMHVIKTSLLWEAEKAKQSDSCKLSGSHGVQPEGRKTKQRKALRCFHLPLQGWGGPEKQERERERERERGRAREREREKERKKKKNTFHSIL